MMMGRLDAMDESREDVESSLEDLIIFPNRDGLRRVVDGMASHFALEDRIVPRTRLQLGGGGRRRSRIKSWESPPPN